MEPRKRRFLVASSVRAELERRGMSPEDLAKAIGMSLSVLNHRLSGKSGFDLDELDAIAQALGVTADSFLETSN